MCYTSLGPASNYIIRGAFEFNFVQRELEGNLCTRTRSILTKGIAGPTVSKSMTTIFPIANAWSKVSISLSIGEGRSLI